MKNSIICGIGIALAGVFCNAAKAQVEYEWVQTVGFGTYNGVSAGTTSGSLILTGGAGGTVSDFTFNWSNGTSPDTSLTLESGTTIAILPDGDLTFTGGSPSYAKATGGSPNVEFSPITTGSAATGEISTAYDNNPGFNGPNVWGDWVAVPEPTTIVSGALMLLPFGASTLRILRKRQQVA